MSLRADHTKGSDFVRTESRKGIEVWDGSTYVTKGCSGSQVQACGGGMVNPSDVCTSRSHDCCTNNTLDKAMPLVPNVQITNKGKELRLINSFILTLHKLCFQ